MNFEEFLREKTFLPVKAQGIRNFVTITGIISSTPKFSHKVFGEIFYTFMLESRRLSDTSDLLPVTFSERIFDKRKMAVGLPVEVTGQIQSHNQMIENKNKLLIAVFSQEINLLNELGERDKNEVTLTGYVCREPVFRQTPFGREITDILLAISRTKKTSEYLPIIAWARYAKYASTLEVGEKIRVIGRIQSRIYQKKDEAGTVTDKTAFEISARKLEKT